MGGVLGALLGAEGIDTICIVVWQIDNVCLTLLI